MAAWVLVSHTIKSVRNIVTNTLHLLRMDTIQCTVASHDSANILNICNSHYCMFKSSKRLVTVIENVSHSLKNCKLVSHTLCLNYDHLPKLQTL